MRREERMRSGQGPTTAREYRKRTERRFIERPTEGALLAPEGMLEPYSS